MKIWKNKRPLKEGSPLRLPGPAGAHMLALEARILLDAAAGETAVEVSELAVHGDFANDFVVSNFSDGAVREPTSPFDQIGFTFLRVPMAHPGDELLTPRSEIAFIAAGVPDLERIISSLSHQTEVVVLEGSGDGLTQIADILSSRSGTDAIHLIGHGREGVLALGGQELSSETMAGYYAGQLATIRDAMADSGDILIYGCNFAGGESGRDAVLALARITGADVAASTDLTGDPAQGGDWTLEAVSGELDTAAIAVENWAGVLAAPIVGDDSYIVEPLVPAIIDPRSNDSDPDGTSLGITEITDPITRVPVAIGVGSPVTLTSGTMIALNADGTLTVTSPPGGEGRETFDYTVEDMNGETSVATVTLLVDTDGDGVIDSTDIDDDNDGILDIVENNAGTGSLIPVGPNLYQGFDNGTFGFESGAPDQYTAVDPYPGGVTNGTFDHFSDIDYGDYTYVANAVTPRNAFQHPNAVDPVYGVTGRFFLSDPDANAPIVSDVISGMVSGETYQYSFWAANSEPFGNPNNIEIRIDGAVAFTTGPLATDPVSIPWTRYTLTFVAPSSGQVSTSLVALETGPGGNDYYLDNIEVRRMGRDGDADGVANSLDLDSDDDGITDNVEAQTTAGYIKPNEADADDDGLDDAYDVDDASADPVLSSGLTPIDTDGDLVSDVLDADSDADGIGDIAERIDGQPATVTSTADSDGDGLLDIFENGSPADGFDVNDQNLDLTSSIFNLAGVPALHADGSNAVPLSTDLLFRDTNDAPLAVNDAGTAAEDTTLIVPATTGLLTNDTDLDGDMLVVSDFTVGAITVAAGSTINLAEGDLTINADGSYTFVPAADYNGPVPVATYTASDGNGGTDTATLTIAVTPVNDAPVAVDDTDSMAEDVTLTVPAAAGLLTDDTDPEGDTLVVSDLTAGATTVAAGATINLTEGDLTINADGSYTFVPAADYNGPVPVATYTVSDGNGGTDTATLTLLVTPVNDAPVAVDDTDTAAEDTTLTRPAASGLLRGDYDPDGDLLTITGFAVNGSPFAPGATASLTEGDLTINADGSYTFVPAADYNGPVPVATYTVSDGIGGTDTATLTIAVTPVNDAPAAVDDTDSTAEDTILTVPAATGLLTNDADPDGDTLVVSDFTVGATTVAAGATINLTEGDLTINADGSYTFVPAADYNGPVPVATYTVSDGNGGTDTATLTLLVTPVNDAPVAVDDTDTAAEDTTLTVPAASGLLRGDFDAEGDLLTITGFSVSGSSFAPGATANLTEGDLTINADGSYTFAPAAHFNGPVPVATYTASDGNGGTDTATLTIAVTPVNDAPVAVDDTDSTAEDVTLTVPAAAGLLTNDTDPDGDTLIVSDFTVGATTVAAGATISLTEGDLTINANGSYTFAPAADFYGPVPVATYTISDGNGGTDTAMLTLSITPVDDAPVAVDDTDSTAEDATLTRPAASGLLRGDFDAEGDLLTITGFSVSGSPFAPGATASLAEGDLAINVDGSYTFVPAADYNGPVPVATYTVSDGNGGTDTATLTIAVTPVNDAPVAVDDANSMAEDTTLTVPAATGLLTDDTDPDGDTLVVSDFTVDATTVAAGSTINLTEGDLTINADGSYTFVPAADFYGPVPVATYTVSDGNGGTDTATLTLLVTPVDDAPVAVDDTDSTAEDATLTVPAASGLLRGDFDAEGDVLTITGFAVSGSPFAPGATASLTEGDLTISADGSYTFVPAADYNGPVPVATYTVSDGNGGTDTATLTLAVTPVNDAPLASDNVYLSNEDTSAAGDIITDDTGAGLDTDADLDTLFISAATVDLDGNGTLNALPLGTPTPVADLSGDIIGLIELAPDGTFGFDPAPDYSGPVPVVGYTISDGNGGTDAATLTITLVPVNDAPESATDAVNVPEDVATPLNATLPTDVDDADSTLVIKVTQVPDAGQQGTIFFVPDGGGAAQRANAGTVLTPSELSSVSFLPVSNYAGPVDSFVYEAEDDDGAFDAGSLGTVAITIIGGNDAPENTVPVTGVGVPVAATMTDEDTPLVFSLANGNAISVRDADGDRLTTTVTVASGILTVTRGSSATVTNDRTASVTLAGSAAQVNAALEGLTYTPLADYNGPLGGTTNTLSIATFDGALTDLDNVAIGIIPVDDITDDAVTTDEDVSITFNMVTGTNGTSADSFEGEPAVTSVTQGTNGTIVAGVSGLVTYTPAAGFHGRDTFTYTVTSGGVTETATVTVTVLPVNDAPVAMDDRNSTTENSTLIVPAATGLLLNDTDVDGDTLTITGFTVNGSSFVSGATANLTAGDLTINADGSYTFVPAPDFSGSQLVSTYALSDGNGGTSNATLVIADAPVTDHRIAPPLTTRSPGETVNRTSTRATPSVSIPGIIIETVRKIDSLNSTLVLDSQSGPITMALESMGGLNSIEQS